MIIDANVVVYWAVPGSHTADAARIMARPDLSAPSIIMAEVAHALINHGRAGTIDYDRIGQMVSMARQAIDTLVLDADLVPDALGISLSRNHRIYDCLYLALALQRREPLATASRRLAALARELNIPTQLIEPSL